MFEVIPAIDIKGGRCVQLRQGKEEDVLFSVDDPASIAKGWVEKGAKGLHIIDLDGAFQHKVNNFELIKKIAEEKEIKEKAMLQVGGGIRSYEITTKFLEIGVDRVILGTAVLKAPSLIEMLTKDFSSEKIMVAVDTKRGRVIIEGWREVTELEAKEVAKKAEKMGAGSLLFTNIEVEGLIGGIKTEVIEDIVCSTNLPVVVSGGVSRKEDVRRIKKTGASGVVIGSALYMGKLDLKDVLAFKD